MYIQDNQPEWPWNKIPDTQSQWETCQKEHKQALEKIENLTKEKQHLRRKLYPNTVVREQDPMQPAGTKYQAHKTYFGGE